jgi:hypothetical protein
MFDLEEVLRGLLNMLGDLMSVAGAEEQGPQNEHVERALQQFDSVWWLFPHSVSRYSTMRNRAPAPAASAGFRIIRLTCDTSCLAP